MNTPKKNTSTTKPAKRTPVSKVHRSTLGFEEIQKLISLVGKEPIDELSLEFMDLRLSVRKNINHSVVSCVTAKNSIDPVITDASSSGTSVDQSRFEQSKNAEIHYVTSPIVGTFYRANNSNSQPFVQIGESVKLGQTLCIIEAMKLMNEIECDTSGELVEILVKDGHPVEYGEHLFAIRVC
jgi:acetyl-CoA carboxylase biotin carboxyl carrier protein